MTRELSVQELIDLSVEENLVPDSKFHYSWASYARWQFDALVQLGLEPQHRLLDVGCGPMRLGQRAIPYLQPGHYYGVDAYEPYLRLGRKVLAAAGVERPFTLLHSETFEFSTLGATFDFAMAQSVFTHLTESRIDLCMAELERVMRPGGRLVFTYILGEPLQGFLYYGTQPMISGRLSGHSVFQRLGEKHGATFARLEVAHPTQFVGQFTFS